MDLAFMVLLATLGSGWLLALWAYSKCLGLRYAVTHDKLTGIFDREGFHKNISSVTSGNFVTAFVDLDDFKAINDTHSHAAGDAAVTVIAQRLKAQAAKYNGIVARFGGDEFALALPVPAQADDRQWAKKTLTAIQTAVTTPLTTDEGWEWGKKSISLTMGATTASPEHCSAIGNLLRAADEALYDTKKHHKGTLRVLENVFGAGLDSDCSRPSSRIRDKRQISQALPELTF